MFCLRHVFEPWTGTIWIRRWFKWHPVVCWKNFFNFIWISRLDFKFPTQFISTRLVSALTIFQVSWIIFIDTVMAEWLTVWLTNCATCLRSELHYLPLSSPWSLVYHAHYCFCVWFLFSYIPTYINAFYVLLSRQIKSSQPTGNSSAILSNSGDRVPAVELTIKSFVYKICQRQKIGCYKNGSQKYFGRVFECYKVQIFVWSQTSNKLQVHSRRILMVKQPR